MNLMALTHPSAICLNARFNSRDEAICELAKRLAELGKIDDLQTYLQEVFHRESIGPTALGEGLAVPHGKSAAVKEAAFAVATLIEPLQWEGVDGPESVELIFCWRFRHQRRARPILRSSPSLPVRWLMMMCGRQ